MERGKPKVRKHRNQSLRYLGNAYAALEAGEPEKAGEFLWGSMAQALKAVAATNDIQLRSHARVGEYARQLAIELGDRRLRDAFTVASYLHSNFYETGLSPEEVTAYAEDIRRAVGKLLELAEGKKQ